MPLVDGQQAKTETFDVTLNPNVCGVVIVSEENHGLTSAESSKETIQSIRAAIERHPEAFHRIEIIAAPMANSFQESLFESVIDACKAECGWVLVATPRCLVHQDAFTRGRQQLGKVDGLWGTLIDLSVNGALSLRAPQVPTATSLEELVLYPWECCLDAGFFIRTDKIFEVVTSSPIKDLSSLCLELWKQARCQKLPLQFVNLKPQADHVRHATRGIIAQHQMRYRRELGIVDGGLALMHKRNLLTSKMQELARQTPDTVNYFAASRQAPWCGYHEVTQFEGQPFILYSHNDDLCTLSLQWTGEYEPASTYLWQRLARNAKFVLDIGAYTGLYSILAARANPTCKVVGFEPLSRNYARFLQNVQLNQLGNVSAVRAAAGRQNGQIGLSIYSHGDFLTSGASIVSTAGRQPVDVETVPMTSIDQLIQSNKLPFPELIKIDAEGAEIEVLSGMTQTLSHRPDLLMECLFGADCTTLENMLKPFGYQFYAVDEARQEIKPTGTLTASSGSLHDLNRLITTRSHEQLMSQLTQAGAPVARVA